MLDHPPHPSSASSGQCRAAAASHRRPTLDDSYYVLYDDEEYYAWRSHAVDAKAAPMGKKESSSMAEEGGSTRGALPTASSQAVSQISAISPPEMEIVAAAVDRLESPAEINRKVLIEQYKTGVPWGMRHILVEIDQQKDAADKRNLKALLLESRARRSKWSHPGRIGQAELYDGLEKVLVDLKGYTPYSLPFIARVSKKDVPDYFEVIKRPMDFATMGKKLKAMSYDCKEAFLRDLNLIYTNCFTYNTAEDSIYRQHVTALRERWLYLMKQVPEIVVQNKGDTGHAVSTAASSSQVTHLDSLSEDEDNENDDDAADHMDNDLDEDHHSASQSMYQSASLPNARQDAATAYDTATHNAPPAAEHPNGLKGAAETAVAAATAVPPTTTANLPTIIATQLPITARSATAMRQYRKDWAFTSTRHERTNRSLGLRTRQLFPELEYFCNSFPDSQTFTSAFNCEPMVTPNEGPLQKVAENIRLLKDIRELRFRIATFAPDAAPEDEAVEPQPKPDLCVKLAIPQHIPSIMHARKILTKFISLFLATVGFEAVQMSALTTFCDVVSDYITKLFTTLRVYLDQYVHILSPEEIARHALYQNGVTTLKSIDFYMRDSEKYARSLARARDILAFQWGEISAAAKPVAEVEEAPEAAAQNDAQVHFSEDDMAYLSGDFGADDLDLDLFGFKEMGMGISSVPQELLFPGMKGKSTKPLPADSKDGVESAKKGAKSPLLGDDARMLKVPTTTTTLHDQQHKSGDPNQGKAKEQYASPSDGVTDDHGSAATSNGMADANDIPSDIDIDNNISTDTDVESISTPPISYNNAVFAKWVNNGISSRPGMTAGHHDGAAVSSTASALSFVSKKRPPSPDVFGGLDGCSGADNAASNGYFDPAVDTPQSSQAQKYSQGHSLLSQHTASRMQPLAGSTGLQHDGGDGGDDGDDGDDDDDDEPLATNGAIS